jgi:hypothetical protein
MRPLMQPPDPLFMQNKISQPAVPPSNQKIEVVGIQDILILDICRARYELHARTITRPKP